MTVEIRVGETFQIYYKNCVNGGPSQRPIFTQGVLDPVTQIRSRIRQSKYDINRAKTSVTLQTVVYPMGGSGFTRLTCSF